MFVSYVHRATFQRYRQEAGVCWVDLRTSFSLNEALQESPFGFGLWQRLSPRVPHHAMSKRQHTEYLEMSVPRVHRKRHECAKEDRKPRKSVTSFSCGEELQRADFGDFPQAHVHEFHADICRPWYCFALTRVGPKWERTNTADASRTPCGAETSLVRLTGFPSTTFPRPA